MKRTSIAVVVASFLLSTGWTIRVLSPLPGGIDSAAYGINNGGHVVGAARDARGQSRAVYWDASGVIQRIPTTEDKTGGTSYSVEINDGLTVAGSMSAPGEREYRGFLWKPGAPAVNELSFGRTTYIYSINNFGDTVGWAYDLTFAQYALLWRGAGASVEDIESGWGFAEAKDVGDGPVVVGYTDRTPARPRVHHAYVWTGGRIRDLGTLGGDNSEAFGVSVGRWPDPRDETIYVVGWSEVTRGSMESRAFVWHRGTMTELPAIKGCDRYEARAINKNQHIVGACRSAGGPWRPLLWKDGSVFDLNDFLPPGSGWALYTAYDINEAGWIVGNGDYEGQSRGFVLIP